jgi:YbbR domain-containing protein
VIERLFRWLANGGLTAWLLGRQAASSLRQNWGIAALAAVLAISLWVYVTDKNDTQRTARVAGAVRVECVNVPPGKAVSPSCSDQTVVVRVRGPDSAVKDLTSLDFHATADLSDVASDTASVRVIVDPKVPRVDVIDVSPAQITVRLEDLTSRNVPVRARLGGPPPRGFDVATTVLEPAEAIVSGPRSLVERVAAVEADLDLTGVHTNFHQTLLLHARDDQGADMQNVTVDPESTRVSVELTQVEFSALFVVEPTITGSPAPGFVSSGLQIDPPFVVVTGPADIFQGLDPVRGVTTEPISIDGASADVVRTVSLRLPQGARVEQPGVTVRVIITRALTGSGTASPAAATVPP